MKKLLISALVLLGLAAPAKAQDYLFDNPDNHSYLGARLGFDIMSLRNQSEIYSNSGGLHMGVVYNMPVWKNLYFEPGVSIFYNRANIKAGNTGTYVVSGNQIVSGRSNGNISNWGFRIPLNIGFHFDITDNVRIAPFTGPVINVNFSSKTNYEFDNPENPSLNYNSLDLGWDFGVGVTYQRYYLAVEGTAGLTKYVKNDPYSILVDGGKGGTYYLGGRRNLFTITLGYNF